ncbi:fungal-specific transcription factor domain-containing protein [Xylariaceae sp. AK1471]|nr:fungal-specific transcription factor domain-containing protein [Xylariaceae sp. AK1471]
MACSITKETADEQEMDISNQENASQRASASRQSSKRHIRHRASIACFSCRDRRIRCVVPKGGSGCTQCKRTGTECVIKMDDERRRPISKAYVSSLSARIDMLEGMLRERGVIVPQAIHPPMTKHEAQSSSSGDEHQMSAVETRRLSNSDTKSPTLHVLSPPESHDDFAMYESPIEDLISTDIAQSGAEPLRKEHSPFRTLGLKQEHAIHRLFSPKGGLSFDHLSAKLRFFGPTANIHVYAESPDRYDSRESPEQIRRAERIISSLTPKTHDYLMQNFWNYHNSVLQVIDRNVFEADRGSENPQFYSSFLHIIILAVGWRFADKDRCDIARINLGNRESTLHREARYMLDLELERPMGISSVQSLLLLGDLECGVGRDNTGWMYAGMANRLAFDVGLHADCSNIGLPDREISIRQRVMKACIFYDKYWALFLGRPTSIKTQDVTLDLSKSTIRPSELNPILSIYTQMLEEEIHEQLVELIDLAGQIVEGRNETRSGNIADQKASLAINGEEEHASMRVLALDQQLRNWYGRLPDHLAWGATNARAAPFSYFLLHQQYHATMILLHRPWENHGSSLESHPSPGHTENTSETLEAHSLSASDQAMDSDNPSSLSASNRTTLAYSVCTQAAIQFAQILAQSKQRFNLEKISCISLQPAGTASTALLAAIVYSKDEADQGTYLTHLEIVLDAIRCMSRSYQPAARMVNLTQAVLAQLLHPDTRKPRHRRGNSFDQGVNANEFKNGGRPESKDIDMFSFLPVRREHYDRDQFLGNNNQRPPASPIRYASRPPLPFDMPPSPSYNQHPLHHSSSMFGLVSNPPGGFFDPDSLRSLTMGVDNIYGHRGHHTSRGVSDDYLRIAPTAGGWGLHSLHSASQLPPQSSPGFDSPMPNWMEGRPAATTAHHERGLGSQSVALSSGIDSKGLLACKSEDASSLEWMSSESELNTLVPISLGHLTHGSQKVKLNTNGNDSVVPPRNHELDFLSF